MRLIDADALKTPIEDRIDNIPASEYDNGWNNAIYAVIDEIDNAPTVEPEKVLVANVTFDKDQLEQLVRDRVIEPIKNGELVLQTDERPHGEWIVDKLTRDVICSNCRQSRRDTRTTHIFFCNHCGADMRKGDET